MSHVHPVVTYNSLHLGDNLIHLHFLRALAKAYPDKKFKHGAPAAQHWQLRPVIDDLPNVDLCLLADATLGVNAWRGFDGWCYQHPHRNEFAALHLDFFRLLAHQLGLSTPFTRARDLLFDYPALVCPSSQSSASSASSEVLVINSPPLSGQFTGFSNDGFDYIIRLLRDAGHHVVTTAPSMIPGVPCTVEQNMDVTAIGRLSQRCRAIIGVATGPIWPTLNIWNADRIKHRIILSSIERVDLLPEHTAHAQELFEVPAILKARGLI